MGEYYNDFRNCQTLDDLKLKLNKFFESFFSEIDSLNIVSLTTDKIIAGTAKISTALIDTLTVGTNVNIGTAQDAAGVTTIIGNTVTTSFVNALNITADTVKTSWVYAGNISASQITAGTLSANYISGGTLSGTTINVTTDLTVGSNITLGTQSSFSKSISFYNSGGYQASISLNFSGDFYFQNQTPGKKVYIVNNSNNIIMDSNFLIQSGGSITLDGASATLPTTAYLGSSQIATQSYVTSQGYATTSYVTSQGYITQTTADGRYVPKNGNVGFYGATPIAQKTATYLDGSASLSDVINKVNGILGIFSGTNYNLISVT